MAYLQTTISGNTNFGGFMSIDGAAAFAIQDDMTYELAPGQHFVKIYSTSNTQRNIAGAQRWLYNNTSSSGAILDSIERKQILAGEGDTWDLQFVIADDQVIQIDVLTSGSRIVSDPMYGFRELDDEEREMLEKAFEELHAEEERIANMPRRSPKKITWGAILGGVGVVMGSGFLLSGQNIEAGIFMLIVAAIGVLLFVLGMRKKVRK